MLYQSKSNFESKNQNKLFLGGRIIESNAKLKSDSEDDKIAYYQSMGQYEAEDKANRNKNTIHKYLKQLKQKPVNKRFDIHIEDSSEFVSGNGGLKNDDISGSSPTRFQRGRKLFVDRNSIKSVLGQSPGK